MWQSEIEAATQWLVGLQNSDGGWSPPYEGAQLSGISTSALVLEALIRSGTVTREIIERGLSFLMSYQQRDGGWPDRSLGCSLTIETSQVLHVFILSEKFRSLNLEHNPIRNAVTWLTVNQNSDGGWGLWSEERHGSMPHHTAWAVIALSEVLNSAHCPAESRNEVVKSLQQAKDFLFRLFVNSGSKGGWKLHSAAKEIDPHTTAFALFALSKNPLIKNDLKDKKDIVQKYLLDSRKSHGIWENLTEELIISVKFNAEEISLDARRVKWWISTPIVLVTLFTVCGQRVYSKEVQETLFIIKNGQSKEGGWGLSLNAKERPLTWVTAQFVTMLIEVADSIDPRLEIGELVKQNIALRQNLLNRIEADLSLVDILALLTPEVSKSKPVVFFSKKGFYVSKRLLFYLWLLAILIYENLVLRSKTTAWLVNVGLLQTKAQGLFIFQGIAVAFTTDVIMRMIDRPFYERIIALITVMLGTVLLGLYAP